MWYWLGLVVAAAMLAAYVAPASYQDGALQSFDLKGVPVAELAQGRAVPSVGLLVPVPAWVTLPETGRAIGAAVYPPQPPYGTTFSMMVALDEAPDDFIEGYRRKLASVGFTFESAPNLMIPTDMAKARFKGTNEHGTRHVFLALRGSQGSWFMQITFWDGLVPM